MLDTTTILLGVLFGSIGFGYYIYGKRQAHPVARYTGIALMVFPYVIEDAFAVVLVGMLLMSSPYFLKL